MQALSFFILTFLDDGVMVLIFLTFALGFFGLTISGEYKGFGRSMILL